MKPLNIAIISDLHIGDKARSKDLRVTGQEQAVDREYKINFLKFLQKHKVKADYLLIPGDIANQADPSEFFLASTVISDIAKTLTITKNKIIFVPGNHDKNWASVPDSFGPEPNDLILQRYLPLRQKKIIFEKILNGAKRHMFKQPVFSLWEFSDVVIVGCNSAWHDGSDSKIHHGLIREETLQEIDEYLGSLSLPPSTLKLCLVHHHPLQYNNPIPDEPDFSIMVNAGNLISILNKHHFDLLVHGHKHKPHFSTHVTNSSFPLVILGAGSFSSEIDIRWSGQVSNQFHLIKISGRDPEEEFIYGEVESWAYLYGKGWLPSQAYNGIKHKWPFGAYIQPAKVRNKLRSILMSKLLEKKHIEWAEIIKIDPSLEYLPEERISEVVRELSMELNLKCYGEFPDGVLLLKE